MLLWVIPRYLHSKISPRKVVIPRYLPKDKNFKNLLLSMDRNISADINTQKPMPTHIFIFIILLNQPTLPRITVNEQTHIEKMPNF